MSTDLAIEAVGLAKSYGSTSVLDHVDLRVSCGGVFALLGPNGAGKTTAVRILATLTRADAGRVRVAGHDVDTQRREVRRRISLTGQYAALDEAQTGEQNLRMMGRLLHLPPRLVRRRAAELLERFDLTAAGRRRVETYSGGMRRRLDLAASLVGEPEIIFLDEPTTGLDPRSRAAMWEIVSELAVAGVTVFLTTQYLDEADRLADRIAIVDGGRVVAEGSAAQLKEQVGGHRLDVELTAAAGPEAFVAVVRQLGPRAVTADPARRTFGITTDGTAAHVRALLDEIDAGRDRVARFDVHGTTLDDVFLTLTARPARAETRPSPTEIRPTALQRGSAHV